MGIRHIIARLLERRQLHLVDEHDLGMTHARAFLRRLIAFTQTDGVLDIGANEGQFGRLLRQHAAYSGDIVSVEPIPALAAQLRASTRNDAKWRVEECGLDMEEGTRDFHIMQGHQFSSLLAPSEDFEGRFHGQHRVKEIIPVNTLTLAKFYQQQHSQTPWHRPLLKLDTQGSELRVLQSGASILSRFAAIYTEVSFVRIYQNAAHFQDILGFMENAGFTLSALLANNQGHFPRLMEMDACFVNNHLLPEMR